MAPIRTSGAICTIMGGGPPPSPVCAHATSTSGPGARGHGGAAVVAFTWYTPFVGILDLSYGLPLDPEPEDREDRFQITFGTPF